MTVYLYEANVGLRQKGCQLRLKENKVDVERTRHIAKNRVQFI